MNSLPKTLAEKIAERSPVIEKYIRLVHAPGDVFEVRGLEVGTYRGNVAGFFNDPAKAAEAIARLDIVETPRGIYITLNPVQAELLSRINNRLEKAKRGVNSTDRNVTRRRWLFVDIDPERAGGVSGIPASDAEWSAAQQRSIEVSNWLVTDHGWSEPIRIDSGNGAYLLFPIDLANDKQATELVKGALAGIASRWSDAAVKIDVAVFNAARICRVLRTVNRKGDFTKERPFRFCGKLKGPDYLSGGWANPIPVEKLQAVAALAPADNSSTVKSKRRKSAKQMKDQLASAVVLPIEAGSESDVDHRLNVEMWLTDRSIEFQPAKTLADGRACWPLLCPFHADHGFDANITQAPDGMLGASCFHSGCAGNNWQEFKERIGPPDPAHFDPPLDSVSDPRPEIFIDEDEHRVIDETIAALAADTELYQRSGELVRIVRGAEILDGVIRPTASPRIVVAKAATIRERITRHARLLELRGEESSASHPKDWQVRGVCHRDYWGEIRPLVGIARTPVMRPDGSILSATGYDPQTGIYLDIDELDLAIPDLPTREQAQEAALILMELFCDFPLEEVHHSSALLALFLTIFGRLAFTGASPLFLIDANIRGSGKSLIADVVGLVTTGDDLPRMSNPNDDDEARKRITSLAIRGDSICLIDNITGQLGSASLDAALTATRWQDRLLGHSEIVDIPLCITWLATGNNVILAADTSRRVCPIRLNCKDEKPEERVDFRFPDLRKQIRANRSRYISAGLTVLRGFHVAGRPQAELPGWGSYEGWSELIRQCVVWVGMPDPSSGRIEMMERADVQASALRMLIESWSEIDPQQIGLTAGELLQRLKQESDEYPTVREAILELCGGTAEKLPTVKSLGSKFRHLRGRIVANRTLQGDPDRTGKTIWKVVEVSAAGSAGFA